MFSNSLEYAIEASIVKFNTYLSSLDDYIHYSDEDYKNAFIQRWRGSMSAVTGEKYIGLTNKNFDKFIIKDDTLVELKFCKDRKWNSVGEDFVNKFNDIVLKMDLTKFKCKLACYDIEEQYNKSIQGINNFKIK
jgi:hypothetical protein